MQRGTMRIFRIFYLLFLILLQGCSSSLSPTTKAVYRIIGEQGKVLTKEKGVHLVGNGMSYPNKLKTVAVIYWIRRNYSLEEARRVYVHIAKDLVNRLNACEEIHSEFSNFPFTVDKNIDVTVAFIKEKGVERVNYPYIAKVSLGLQTVIYKTYNHDFQCYEKVFEEPYEEAIRIVEEERCFSEMGDFSE